MASDDYDFLNFIATSVPQEAQKLIRDATQLSNDLASQVEKKFDAIACLVREQLRDAPYIADYLPPLPRVSHGHAAPPRSQLESLQAWIFNHVALSAALMAFFGTGSFILLHLRRESRLRRRARRTRMGSKAEVIILAGSPYSPLTQTLAYDLNRRGFVVYVAISSVEEEDALSLFLSHEIRPLLIDVSSPSATAAALERFTSSLHRSGLPKLRLISVIILTSYPTTHPTGQISTIEPSTWSATLDAHLLYPVSLLHSILPLLTTGNHSHGRPPSLVLITPNIIPSLTPASHAPESATTAALTAILATLRNEYPSKYLIPSTSPTDSGLSSPLSISHLHLGAITIPAPPQPNQLITTSPTRGLSPSSLLITPESTIMPESTLTHHQRAELRNLHATVFDAAVGRRTGTIFVGRGAATYAFVGRWAPRSVVGWMMERRRQGEGNGLMATMRGVFGLKAEECRQRLQKAEEDDDARMRSSESGSGSGSGSSWEDVGSRSL